MNTIYLNVRRCKRNLAKHSDIQMNFLHELLKTKFPKLDISRVALKRQINNFEYPQVLF